MNLYMVDVLFQSVFPFLLGGNPNTGDRNVTIMGIVIGAMVISLVAIVILSISSKKKGKK